MLILPVLVELIMLIGDTAGVKYTSGLEKDKDIRGSVVDLAVKKFKDEPEEEGTDGAETTIKEMKEAADERATGLMSRRMQ